MGRVPMTSQAHGGGKRTRMNHRSCDLLTPYIGMKDGGIDRKVYNIWLESQKVALIQKKKTYHIMKTDIEIINLYITGHVNSL